MQSGAERYERIARSIVCLTEETIETIYLLGEGERIVGISGYTVRPPEAHAKPKVSAFINARFEKIEALRPDIAELIRRGYPRSCRSTSAAWPRFSR